MPQTPIRLLLTLLAVLVGTPDLRAAESVAVVSPRATVTLISDTERVAPGQPYRVALRLRLAPGWHTYWQNPGDAGIAPELAFTLPPGVTAGPIIWPTPTRQPEDALMTYGYAGEVILPATISGGPGPVTIDAIWLVCAKICVPEEGKFTLDLPSGPPQPSAQTALFARADAAQPRPSPFPAHFAPDGTLTLIGEGIEATADAWFMPLTPDAIAASAKQSITTAPGRLTLTLRPAAAFRPDLPLAGVLVLRDRGGAETALAIAATPAPIEPSVSPLLHILAAAFLGGLILNLMPCVFPVLAMKAIGLAGMTGQSRAHARIHAAAYAGGVMATFIAIAFTLLALRHAGAAAGWGFQFQSPLFVGLMACVLFAVGLNLSGVFHIGGNVGAGQSFADRDGLPGSFFAGTLAVLVATPCTAPFMSIALTTGLAGTPLTTVVVFAALGAGLAAPYVLLASLPVCARLLPRPGAWMDVLKQVLAFPMYGAVVWLIWVISIETGPPGVLATATALTLVAFAAWAMQFRPRIGRPIAALAGIGAIVLIANLTLSDAIHPPTPGAEAFSTPRLAELRAAGKPVFVNITAAWCVSCLVNERVALSRDSTRAALAERGIAYLKGDWTRQDPAITAYLKSNGADGVPFYIYYPPNHRAPVVLPQILTAGIVTAAFATTP